MSATIIVNQQAYEALYRSEHEVSHLHTYRSGMVQIEVPNELRQALIWDIRPGEVLSDAVIRMVDHAKSST